MSKVLYAASVPIHLANFHRPYIQKLIDRGDEVWTLCSGDFTQPGTAGHIDFPLKNQELFCPECFGKNLSIQEGRDMVLKSIEGD